MGDQPAIRILNDDVDVAEDGADLLGALVVDGVGQNSVGVAGAGHSLEVQRAQFELVEDIADP
jgi:hypothetical protein